MAFRRCAAQLHVLTFTTGHERLEATAAKPGSEAPPGSGVADPPRRCPKKS